MKKTNNINNVALFNFLGKAVILMKNHFKYQFKMLTCISGVDYPNNTYRFQVDKVMRKTFRSFSSYFNTIFSLSFLINLEGFESLVLNQISVPIDHIKTQELTFLAEYFLISALFCLTLFALFSLKLVVDEKHFLIKFQYNNQLIFLLIFGLACYLILIYQQIEFSLFSLTSFNGTICNDMLSIVAKLIIGISSIFYLIFLTQYLSDQKLCSFEYYIILLTSIFGFFLLCGANDLITAYLAIELQGLAFYVLVSFKNSSNFSIESGVKYFVIGSLSLALFLFGVTFISESVFFTDFQNLIITIFNTQNSFIIVMTITLTTIIYGVSRLNNNSQVLALLLPLLFFFLASPEEITLCMDHDQEEVQFETLQMMPSLGGLSYPPLSHTPNIISPDELLDVTENRVPDNVAELLDDLLLVHEGNQYAVANMWWTEVLDTYDEQYSESDLRNFLLSSEGRSILRENTDRQFYIKFVKLAVLYEVQFSEDTFQELASIPYTLDQLGLNNLSYMNNTTAPTFLVPELQNAFPFGDNFDSPYYRVRGYIGR